MSHDNVASSITLGNFNVGRLYPNSSPTPIFASDGNEIGSHQADLSPDSVIARQNRLM